MLSKIQIYLEKNRKWLFGFLLVVIVVPFVFTIGNMPGLGCGKKRNMQTLFGCNLGDSAQMEKAIRDGAISISLRTGSEDNAWMESAQGYAFYRLMLLQLSQKLMLPVPSEELLHNFIKEQKLFMNDKHEFDPQLYNDYLAKWSERFGKTQKLRSLIEDDYKCEQIRKVLSKPGFALPEEAESMYKHWKTTYKLRYISIKNEVPVPGNVTVENVEHYFDEHKADYNVERRAEISLLFFDNNKHRSELTMISEEQMRQFFEKNTHLFLKDGKTVAFEEAKNDVRKHLELVQLKELAEKKATQFAINVYGNSIKIGTPMWIKSLAMNEVRVIDSLPPYTPKTLPKKKGLSKDILLKAFDLDAEHFLSDPIDVKNGCVLIALKRFHEPYIPELETIKDKVTEDCKKFMQREIFENNMEKLCEELRNSGKDYSSVLDKNKVKLQDFEEFTLENFLMPLSNLLDFSTLFDFIKELEVVNVGQWINVKYNGESAIIFYCEDKVVPKDVDSAKLTEFSTRLKTQKGSSLAEIVLKEMLEESLQELHN